MPLAFFASAGLPLIASFFQSVFPVLAFSLGFLLKFSLERVSRLPSYIKLLHKIFRNTQPGSDTHKIVTVAMLILGGILSFMAFSFVPFTGVPIIGLATAPVATLLSVTVILLTLDLLMSLNAEFSAASFAAEYGDIGESLADDLLTVKHKVGPKWDKAVKQFHDTIQKTYPQLQEWEEELSEAGKNFAAEIDSYFCDQMADLTLYLGQTPDERIKLTETEIKIVSESLESWKKVNAATVLGGMSGTGVGVGASSVASSVFMPATLVNKGLAFIGVKSGVMVSTSAYSLLTFAAPVALGLSTGATVFGGAMYALNEVEKRRLSAFLADVIIAALPIAYADGHFSTEEKESVQQLLVNAAILKKDQQRILDAMESTDSFDDVINQRILHEAKPEKAQIKNRLLLAIAWEIAKADGEITESEEKLHSRMAKILQVSDEANAEIRRLITPAQSSTPKWTMVNTDQDAELEVLGPI